jgi:pyruvate formate lyase activating enzyme
LREGPNLAVENSNKGLIFDIQGHSVHDGPGTRTLIFLSGCPLRCGWCSNPEGQLVRQRLMFKALRCKGCPRRCIAACPHDAVRATEQSSPLVEFDWVQCNRCESHECQKVCYMSALELSGRWYSVDELMTVLRRDSGYWGSNGGVTLSGGEPLVQIEFVTTLLKRCRESGIAACIETSAHIPRENIEAVLPYVQWLFIDVKHMNTELHRAKTAAGNETILANIRWIAGSGWPGHVLLRMPVIPGFNDSIVNAQATAAFMKDCGLGEINLLPFHRLGASKHEQLGLEYEFMDQSALQPEDLEPLAAVYRENNIACYVGSDTPF